MHVSLIGPDHLVQMLLPQADLERVVEGTIEMREAGQQKEESRAQWEAGADEKMAMVETAVQEAKLEALKASGH